MAAGVLHERERLGKDVVKSLALRNTVLELLGHARIVLVREILGLVFPFYAIDLTDDRPEPFELSIVLCSKQKLQNVHTTPYYTKNSGVVGEMSAHPFIWRNDSKYLPLVIACDLYHSRRCGISRAEARDEDARTGKTRGVVRERMAVADLPPEKSTEDIFPHNEKLLKRWRIMMPDGMQVFTHLRNYAYRGRYIQQYRHPEGRNIFLLITISHCTAMYPKIRMTKKDIL